MRVCILCFLRVIQPDKVDLFYSNSTSKDACCLAFPARPFPSPKAKLFILASSAFVADRRCPSVFVDDKSILCFEKRYTQSSHTHSKTAKTMA